MKSTKKGKSNIKFGFVGAGYSPIASKLIFSPYAKMYLHIIFLENQNQYVCNGMTAFNKHKIPVPFSSHEFSEFYGNKPPEISNNKEKAVNELVQNIVVN